MKLTINFVKESNISGVTFPNKLLGGWTDWGIIVDLERHFSFSTEIILINQCQNLVIRSVNLKRVYIIRLTIPLEENIDWAHQ